MVRTKQGFPHASYSKIVEAIMNGYRNPSDMLKHKVLSKRKLHAYLKMFSKMGFLIRKRLPKRGNYVEYYLNEKEVCLLIKNKVLKMEAYSVPIYVRGTMKMAQWMSKKRVRKRLELEWELSKKPIGVLRKDRKYRRLLQKLSREEGWKEVKFSEKISLLVPRGIKSTAIGCLTRKYGEYFEEYPLLRDLIPLLIHRKTRIKVGKLVFDAHPTEEIQLKDIIELIDKIKNLDVCPECMKQVTLHKYLQNGIKSLPLLKSVPQEGKGYCPLCSYEKKLYFEQQL